MGYSFDNGRIRVESAQRRLLVDGEPQRLGSRAFDLLLALCREPGQVVPKQRLLQQVWPGLVVEENTLQVHVASLRRLLGAGAIATISGRGYSLTAVPDLPSAGPATAAGAGSASPSHTDTAGASPDLATAPGGPGDTARLFGREALLQTLSAALADPATRLLVLTGAGGSGKTRLALQATAQAIAPPASAAALAPDGAWAVLLAPVREPAQLMTAIAVTLGLQESSAQPAAALVLSFLQSRQLLLTLDNLEHLLPDATAIIEQLLATAPGLKLLVTSRRPLRVAGARELAVPPLALPLADDDAALQAAPALQLLAQRAREAGRPLAAGDWRAAAAICRQLDGLPLAIELAAARLRVLSPAALAARLPGSLGLLASRAGTERRHQTLRSAIAWSHALLAPAAQRLFNRLGVFAGGWPLDGAEALADEPGSAVDLLETLLDLQLVQRLDDLEGEPRYTMLQTLREYALEQLAAQGEEAAMRERHARHALARAEALAPRLASADRRPALARLAADLNNLRAALRWWSVEQPAPALALRLAAALAWAWYFLGLYAEGRAALQQALATAPPEADAAPGDPAAAWSARASRATALSGAARLAAYSGDHAGAFSAAEASVAIWRDLLAAAPDASLDAALARSARRGLALARFHEGVTGIIAQQLPRARAALEEALRCFRGAAGEPEDAWGVALALSYLGTAYAVEPGQEGAARPLLLEGRARFQALGDEWGQTVSSHYLGSIALRTGAWQEARELTQEMLAVARELGDRYRIARNLHQLAEIDLAQGRWHTAASRLAESLALNAEHRRLGDAALQLRALARVAEACGRPEDALRLAALAAAHAAGERTMPPRRRGRAREARGRAAREPGAGRGRARRGRRPGPEPARGRAAGAEPGLARLNGTASGWRRSRLQETSARPARQRPARCP